MRKLLFLFLLVLLIGTQARADDIFLQKAVEKLIIDVHNLKERVAELEARVGKKEAKKQTAPAVKKQTIKQTVKKYAEKSQKSSDSHLVTVIRGKFVKSRTSCRLATVKRVTEKGKRELLSLLPPEAPLYVRKFRGNYVYLTLPDYCEAVKEKIKDASLTRIHIW